MRERGLGDVELVGGAREVAVPDDRLEVPELADLHPMIQSLDQSFTSLLQR